MYIVVVGLSPRGHLPLRLGGQAPAHPRAVRLGFVPRDVHDRRVGAQWRGRTVEERLAPPAGHGAAAAADPVPGCVNMNPRRRLVVAYGLGVVLLAVAVQPPPALVAPQLAAAVPPAGDERRELPVGHPHPGPPHKY